MAYQAFNFGKQLGIVGEDNASEDPPVSGRMEVPVLGTHTKKPRRGGYWLPTSRPVSAANPLNAGEREILYVPDWVWFEGPDTGGGAEAIVIGGGPYRPWEVPRVIELIELSQKHPEAPSHGTWLKWGVECSDGEFHPCRSDLVKYVEELIFDILYEDTRLQIYDSFSWILECMREQAGELTFGCCPGMPLPDNRASTTDFAWREQIIDRGIVWLNPDQYPTRLELIRALTQRCGGYNDLQQKFKINDLTAYLLAGEVPPCELLQRFLDAVTPAKEDFFHDKYFTHNPETGEIFWLNPDKTRAWQINIGSEHMWKCRRIDNPDGTHNYDCGC